MATSFFLPLAPTQIRRISDDAIEAALLEDLGEGGFPVEDIDAEAGVLVEHVELGVVVEVGADEGVAAADVAGEVGEDALAFGEEVALDDLVGLAFEHLEQEREFGDLDGGGVDIHAVDIGEQDGEFVRAVGVSQVADDVLERLVVQLEGGRERVGFLGLVFFAGEVEQAGVVAGSSAFWKTSSRRG